MSDRPPAVHRGRFAPSPTGPLHFGSLVAALASYLQAHARGGEWLVRIEDLDTPRNLPGSTDDILDDLERLGFEWHGEAVRQSARLARYADALEELATAGATFPCGCSRRDLVEGIYPGTCRGGIAPGRTPRSVRLRIDDAIIAFDDGVLGPRRENLAETSGDFVLRRADGIFAYHLAVVVDDAAQGVTEVVRGSDLLDSTARQIRLQRALGYPTPEYAHVPIAVDAGRNKLSKQTLAAPVRRLDASSALGAALDFLGHRAPPTLRAAPPRELLAWARGSWRLGRVPRCTEIQVADPAAPPCA